MQNLGLVNSIWALILPTAVPVFNVIILMNFFKGTPDALEEATIIDGAGQWTILFKIFLPISLPSLATVGLFSIVGHWNDYFQGLLYIQAAEELPAADLYPPAYGGHYHHYGSGKAAKAFTDFKQNF